MWPGTSPGPGTDVAGVSPVLIDAGPPAGPRAHGWFPGSLQAHGLGTAGYSRGTVRVLWGYGTGRLVVAGLPQAHGLGTRAVHRRRHRSALWAQPCRRGVPSRSWAGADGFCTLWVLSQYSHRPKPLCFDPRACSPAASLAAVHACTYGSDLKSQRRFCFCVCFRLGESGRRASRFFGPHSPAPPRHAHCALPLPGRA